MILMSASGFKLALNSKGLRHLHLLLSLSVLRFKLALNSKGLRLVAITVSLPT